jgi:hypothetical protein
MRDIGKAFVFFSYVLAFPVAAAAPAEAAGRAVHHNLVKNGPFATELRITGNGSMPPSSVAGWTAAFRDPQLVAAGGCAGGSGGYVAMWGNQAAGEGIRQTLTQPLVQGQTYRLSACVRYVFPGPAGPVRFRVRASNGPLPAYTSPGVPIGVTPAVTSTNWVTMSLPHWSPNVAGLDTITITPENGFAVNDGAKVSWGHVDNVCLEPVDMIAAGTAEVTKSYAGRDATRAFAQLESDCWRPVPARDLAAVLTGRSFRCVTTTCAGGSCASDYEHPDAVWSGFDGQISVAEQQSIIGEALKIGEARSEYCGTVKKSVSGFTFRQTSSGGPVIRRTRSA